MNAVIATPTSAELVEAGNKRRRAEVAALLRSLSQRAGVPEEWITDPSLPEARADRIRARLVRDIFALRLRHELRLTIAEVGEALKLERPSPSNVQQFLGRASRRAEAARAAASALEAPRGGR